MKKTLLSAILFLGIYTNAQISTLQTVTDWSNQMNMTKDGMKLKILKENNILMKILSRNCRGLQYHKSVNISLQCL